ncbi:MAG: nicotinamide riboside transporter PnuC [Burkholderiales bacterium]|nr:nicotinamide riboside transporter PnuC [Burkholderiales bacterium]
MSVSILEIIGFIASLLGIWLATRSHVLTWPLQLIASMLYVWLFFDAKLFGESLLQFVYAALAIYGWWMWKRSATDHSLPISKLNRREWLLINGGGLLLTLLVTRFQVQFLPTDLPLLDSGIFVFGLIAQWMQARKKIENWPYWIVLDLIASGVYAYKGLHLTAVLYIILTALAVSGWISWRKEIQKEIKNI